MGFEECEYGFACICNGSEEDHLKTRANPDNPNVNAPKTRVHSIRNLMLVNPLLIRCCIRGF
jgi:hypothetical protein